MKPFNWIDRMPVHLKKDVLHNKVIKLFGYSYYLKYRMWELGTEEIVDVFYRNNIAMWENITNSKCITKVSY